MTPNAVAAEAHNGYGLMFVSLEKTATRGYKFRDDITALAAEGAIVMALIARRPLTALYVAPGGKKKRARQHEEANLKDIVALADTYEVTLQTAVRANIAPDQAILKEMARRRHNLLVLAAERRPGEKLYFGDTAAALLEKSPKSLLFVAS